MIRFGRLETARCTLCGAETSVSSGSNIDGALVEIGNWADQHEAKHRAWAEIGATIAGQVFDTNAAPERAGIVTRAVWAAADGMAYLVWNGWIYPTANPDLSKPICQARDVPGIKEG